ncbi:actin-like [Frankliniella occidentalis]|nr:actin-like [Frankliniella occidentalis]
MVYKAIQECSMDARKTMARSVFLAGGLTMLPGFAERLREELAALLPPAVQPKVHASPYRYHAAYLGACVLANSSGVQEMSLTREEFNRDGGKLLRPWIL